MLLSERLPRAAGLYPEAPAFLHQGCVMSYSELDQLVTFILDPPITIAKSLQKEVVKVLQIKLLNVAGMIND
ncbi:hypothetical protein [Paenibacillus sp. FSL R7-0652]|jgi:hypothetical protein|uniref:Uncharacterized protein n=1 Tax=Paenibacillus sp. AN1007 TaxID=3151385 RepID=A0AAU8NE25_9BACL